MADEIIPTRAGIVAARLQTVRDEIQVRFVEMGELLLEAHRGNYHLTLGFKSFNEFAEKTLGMSARKARYLLDCFRVYVEDFAIPEAEMAEIGWTKASLMLPVVTHETAPVWIARAKTMSAADLSLAVRQAQAPPGKVELLSKYSTMGVGLYDDERPTIEKAIEYAMRSGSTDRQGRALFLICAEYVASAEAAHAEALRRGFQR